MGRGSSTRRETLPIRPTLVARSPEDTLFDEGSRRMAAVITRMLEGMAQRGQRLRAGASLLEAPTQKSEWALIEAEIIDQVVADLAYRSGPLGQLDDAPDERTLYKDCLGTLEDIERSFKADLSSLADARSADIGDPPETAYPRRKTRIFIEEITRKQVVNALREAVLHERNLGLLGPD